MTVKELRNKLFAFADDTEVEIVTDITNVESVREGRTKGVLTVVQLNDVVLVDTEYGKDVGTTANERALLVISTIPRGRVYEA